MKKKSLVRLTPEVIDELYDLSNNFPFLWQITCMPKILAKLPLIVKKLRARKFYSKTAGWQDPGAYLIPVSLSQ